MTITLKLGDCREIMPTLGQQFHAAVTDPPYELGFMGKKWDSTGVAFSPDTWRAVCDRLLPGAYLVAFGGTRTYHRMVCAIEDAGFIIHPMLGWLFGSGFPKAADASKAIDRHLGKEREVVGQRQGKGGGNLNILAREGGADATDARGCGAYGQGARQTTINIDITAPATPEAAQWAGWKYGLQSLKPALEPICLAQKPMEGNGAENILKHGVGALNVDASRIQFTSAEDEAESKGKNRHADFDSGPRDNAIYGKDTAHRGKHGNYNPPGRYPANLIHDGSPDVLDAFAALGESKSSGGKGNASQRSALGGHVYGDYSHQTLGQNAGGLGDTGTAARFFYSAKADAADRADSKHPTVKPVDLIRWLVKLVTPPGGHILDPFAGSGTTAEAAMLEGFNCTLIEQDPQHAADIKHRIKRWSGQDTPLFATLPAE